MQFTTNQVVWARAVMGEDWQPGLVIDISSDIWRQWNEPVQPVNPGKRHVFLMGSRDIKTAHIAILSRHEFLRAELLDNKNHIRDFCLGYCECVGSVDADSRSLKPLRLLVQIAASLSGEDIGPDANYDWQQWAVNNVQQCEPIRVGKRFYEKFLEPSTSALRNSPSSSPSSAHQQSNDESNAKTNESSLCSPSAKSNDAPRHRAKKTIAGKKKPKAVEATMPSVAREPEFRTSQLVWARKVDGVSNDGLWYPCVIMDIHQDSSLMILAYLNKTRDLFYTLKSFVEDFCRSFPIRVSLSQLEREERGGQYGSALRRAVDLAQDAIKDVECAEDNWLNWAQSNLYKYNDLQLSRTQWVELRERVSKRMNLMKCHEVHGKKTRASSHGAVGAIENGATSSNSAKGSRSRAKSTPPNPSEKADEEKKRIAEIDAGIEVIPEGNNSTAGDSVQVSDMDRHLAANMDIGRPVEHTTVKLGKKRKHESESKPRREEDQTPVHKSKKSFRGADEKSSEKKQHKHRSYSPPTMVKPKHYGASSISANKSSRLRKGGSNATEETVKVPLDRGWLREIVTRKTGEKRACDVYYYQPYSLGKGKKLRSGNDVAKLLEAQSGNASCRDLDVRTHFSFNGLLMTGHDRECLHEAGGKMPSDLLSSLADY